jgi:UDP-N-acetylglucosamine--N-acetylmuramyl-(pentapeptide) pyrophosphoryl-undecaprenol N-acetylglucosamine transferase
VLHEQNSVAGMANKVLAGVADRVFTAFPECVSRRPSGWATRCARRSRARRRRKSALRAAPGPLRLLVVGGSLGAQGAQRHRAPGAGADPAGPAPVVTHQSGATQIDALRANYEAAGVQAELTPFIEDTASAFAQADIIVCRAGASTVTEIAAVGAAAVFVPFPFGGGRPPDHQRSVFW